MTEICGFPAANHKRAQDGGDDARSGEHQRQNHLVGVPTQERSAGGCRGSRQGNGRNDRTDVGLKQVGAHSGHVANVIPHIVRNHSGVPGIVFRDTGLNLTHQVGPNVGGLGENSAANPGEKRYRTGAETESGHHANVLEDNVKDGDSQEADAHHGYPHHRAAGKRHPQRRVQTPHCRRRSPGVGPHRHEHSNEAGRSRTQSSGQIGDRGLGDHGVQGIPVDEHPQHGRNHHDKGQQDDVFTAQESVGALADRGANVLHPLVSRIGAQDPNRHAQGEQQRHTPGG